MPRLDKEPHWGESVWCEARRPLQPNGKVVRVDNDAEEVYVEFYDNPSVIVSLSLDEFYGNWSDKYGGAWLLEDVGANKQLI